MTELEEIKAEILSRPYDDDFSDIEKMWEILRSGGDGSHYTPRDVARMLAANTLVPVLLRCTTLDDIRNLRICDPACGMGVFLCAAAELVEARWLDLGGNPDDVPYARTLHGVELHADTADICAHLLSHRLRSTVRVSCADSLFNPPSAHVYLGNPPFLGSKRISTIYGDKYKSDLQSEYPGSMSNLALYFLRMATSQPPCESVGLVLPSNVFKGRDVDHVRRMLSAGWEITYADTDVPWPGDAQVHVCYVAMERTNA